MAMSMYGKCFRTLGTLALSGDDNTGDQRRRKRQHVEVCLLGLNEAIGN